MMRTSAAFSVPLLALGSLTAQLPEWQLLPVPSPTSTFLEAHIVVVQDPGAVHAFSTFTRRWSTQPTTSPGATYHGFDDHVVVEDGATFYGYASRYGVFVPLQTTSPTPSVPPLASSSFLTVVRDGTLVHAFSPFTGRWNTLQVANSSTVAPAKIAAVFTDGPLVYGYSPLHGDFVPLQAAHPIVAASAGGYCAHATDGTTHYAFSGVRNTWTTLPSAATATVTVGTGRHGAIVLQDGLDVDLFSGITGNVTRIACTQPPTLWRGEQTVVVQEGPFTHAWSAITDDVRVLISGTPPTVTVQNQFALVQDGQELHAFSAPKGTFAPPLQGSWTFVHGYNVALATDAGNAHKAYSAFLGRWVDGPAGAFSPATTENGAILLDAAGALHGFSVRTGTWSSIATNAIDGTWSHGSSWCARAGNDLYAFNELRGSWSHTTTASPATVSLKRETILATFGSAATAYSTWLDRWSPVTLASAPSAAIASDDSALVQDASGVHAYGGSCQVTTWGLYPEWWRFLTRGTPCPIHVAGEHGVGAFLGIGFDTAAITFPGIAGTLGIAPTNSTALFGILPAAGTWVVPLAIPDVAGLVGVTVHMQALVLPASGPYFTTVYPTTIL